MKFKVEPGNRFLVAHLGAGLAFSALICTAGSKPIEFRKSNSEYKRCLIFLREALESRSPVNVQAKMVTSEFPHNRKTEVEITESSTGFIRTEYPGSKHGGGFVVIDTPTSRLVFNPHRKSLMVGPAPVKGKSIDWQLQRIEANYSLSYTHAVSHGLEIVVIRAHSRYPSLGDRRIYIDPNSHFVLRQDVIEPGGESPYLFTTLSISFPSSFRKNEFVIRTHHGVDAETYIPASDSISKSKARMLAGKGAQLTSDWPLGFRINSISEGAKWQGSGIVMDVTNGLEHATVIESINSKTPEEVMKRLKNREPLVGILKNTVIRIYSSIPLPAARILFARALK